MNRLIHILSLLVICTQPLQVSSTKFLCALFLFLTIFSCSPNTQALTETERIEIISNVKLMLDNYYADIKKDGLTAEFKYLDSSSDFFWVPPGYSHSISYDSVATVLKQNAPKYKLIENSFDTLRIIPLTSSLATYTGRLVSKMTDTAGNVIVFSLVETGVLTKRKDGWKLLSGQTSIIGQ